VREKAGADRGREIGSEGAGTVAADDGSLANTRGAEDDNF
jgi:hypothetical protein